MTGTGPHYFVIECRQCGTISTPEELNIDACPTCGMMTTLFGQFAYDGASGERIIVDAAQFDRWEGRTDFISYRDADGHFVTAVRDPHTDSFEGDYPPDAGDDWEPEGFRPMGMHVITLEQGTGKVIGVRDIDGPLFDPDPNVFGGSPDFYGGSGEDPEDPTGYIQEGTFTVEDAQQVIGSIGGREVANGPRGETEFVIGRPSVIMWRDWDGTIRKWKNPDA